MSLLNAVRIPALATPRAAVIFVHGLGDSGEGWLWLPRLVSQSGLVKNHDSINYVFPNAPEVPVTANFGHVMPSWFDITEFGNPKGGQNKDDFLKSCNVIKAFIDEQITKGIPADKIILGGFSQGAAISYATAALLEHKIGGVVVLSGFCPIGDILKEKNTGVNAKTPIFQGHGTADPVVNFEFGKLTHELFKELGFENIRFESYPGMAHNASEEELVEVVKLINQVVNE